MHGSLHPTPLSWLAGDCFSADPPILGTWFRRLELGIAGNRTERDLAILPAAAPRYACPSLSLEPTRAHSTYGSRPRQQSTHPPTHTHKRTSLFVCIHKMARNQQCGHPAAALHCTALGIKASLTRPIDVSLLLPGSLHSRYFGFSWETGTAERNGPASQPASPMDRCAALCCHALCSMYEWARGRVCWTGGW